MLIFWVTGPHTGRIVTQWWYCKQSKDWKGQTYPQPLLLCFEISLFWRTSCARDFFVFSGKILLFFVGVAIWAKEGFDPNIPRYLLLMYFLYQNSFMLNCTHWKFIQNFLEIKFFFFKIFHLINFFLNVCKISYNFSRNFRFPKILGTGQFVSQIFPKFSPSKF